MPNVKDPTLNVLLIGAGSAQAIRLVLRRLQRRPRSVRVCGVIYQSEPPQRVGLALGFLHAARKLANLFVTAMFNFIHGTTGKFRRTTKNELEELSAECTKGGADLFLTSSCADSAALEFARRHCANVGVVLGPVCLGFDWHGVFQSGWVSGETTFLDSQGREFADARECIHLIRQAKTRVHHTTKTQSCRLLASVELCARPLDTNVSLKLKSGLILRDLLSETVLALAKSNDPIGHLSQWVSQMVPLESSNCNDSRNKVSQPMRPNRIRAKWKLLCYLLIEFSPFVIFRNWVWRWRKKFPVIILAHHLVSDSYHHMNISTDVFFELVRFLKKYYRIASLSEANSLLRSGSIEEPTVVLTFDDGYEENFLSLRAVAEQLDVSVTMFVSTAMVQERTEFSHDLEKGIVGFRALSWEQIRYWSHEGAEFGSHTRSHFDCGSSVVGELEEEIVQSKVELENESGNPVFAFAFPFGKRENISEAALEIARTNYECILSYYGGANFASATKRHLLRKDFYSNFCELELEVQDLFELVQRLRARLDPFGSKTVKRGLVV